MLASWLFSLCFIFFFCHSHLRISCDLFPSVFWFFPRFAASFFLLFPSLILFSHHSVISLPPNLLFPRPLLNVTFSLCFASPPSYLSSLHLFVFDHFILVFLSAPAVCISISPCLPLSSHHVRSGKNAPSMPRSTRQSPHCGQ